VKILLIIVQLVKLNPIEKQPEIVLVIVVIQKIQILNLVLLWLPAIINVVLVI